MGACPMCQGSRADTGAEEQTGSLPPEEIANKGRTYSVHTLDAQHHKGGPDFLSTMAAVSLSGVPWKEKGAADEWVNKALVSAWPVMKQVIAKEAFETAAEEIKDNLPDWIEGEVSLERFVLGSKPPVVGRIECSDTAKGLKVQVGFEYEDEVDIAVALGCITGGISWMKASGDVTLLMEPLVEETTLVGAVKGYFVDPPDLDFTFSGAAKAAELPLVKSAVRLAIDQVVAHMAVVPHFLSTQLVTFKEEDFSDGSRVPLGVLRAEAISAKGLTGSDWHLFGKATSDPFLRLKVGDQSWSTSTVKSTCDPKWSEQDVHDFVVYDKTQLLSIKVFDNDCITADDRLGQPEQLQVNDALKVSGKCVPIFEKTKFIRRGASYTAGPGRGELLMKYTWLNPGKADEERRKKGLGEGYLLMVDVDKLTLPASLAKRVQVIFTVAGNKTHSRFLRTPAESVQNAVDAVDKVVMRVIKNGAKTGLNAQALSEMTGLKESHVRHVLSGGDTKKEEVQGSLVAASVKFDSHLAIPLKAEHAVDSEMTVEIRDRRKCVLAHTKVNLADVPLNAPSNVHTTLDLESKLAGTFALGLRLSLRELQPGDIPKC